MVFYVGLPAVPEGLVGEDGLVALGGERVFCEVYQHFLSSEDLERKLRLQWNMPPPSDEPTARLEREEEFLRSSRRAQKTVEGMVADGIFNLI